MFPVRVSCRLINVGVVFVLLLGLAVPMQTAKAAASVCIAGGGCFATIQAAINAASPGNTVNVAAGTYDEDVNLSKSLSLLGAGAGSTIIRGVIGGDSATVHVAASNVTIAGFTITRLGNTVADWNNSGLNTAGIAIQGASTGMIVRDNTLTGNRTGIDINNSSGQTIRNNVITDNRTGMILRNQTNNLTIVENGITNNWTLGIVFLDASVGTNSPVQTALNCTFSNNNISGNWYGQIVDRQTGGSLPLPGTNLKNFSGNWFGTTTPAITTVNSAEPGYADQIPVAFGGTAVPPGGQSDILGPASANIDFTPCLNSGTDTNVETTSGRGTGGFQGGFSMLNVSAASPQTGSTGRIQEAINLVSGSTVNVAAGMYTENVTINKALNLLGAQFSVAVAGRTAASAGESTIQGLVTVDTSDVNINGFTLTNPGQTNALYVKNHTPSHSNIIITYSIVDNVGSVVLTSNVHAILINKGPDSVTIAHNRFNNLKAGTKSVSAVGVLDSASTDPSTNLVIQDNAFTNIASTDWGAYGILINNAAGAPGAQIKDNTFSGLNGAWTHAIGLEGPTLNASVTGNIFSGLAAASVDNAAIFFEKNSAGNTVAVSHNQFNGTTFYGVAIHLNDLQGGSNGYNYTVNAENNWWGSATGPTNASNPGGTGVNVGDNVTFNPWCTGSACIAALPTITSLTPNSAMAGGAAFTLIVNGANFANNAQVQWNRSNRPTIFINATQLTTAINAADIAALGVPYVTVDNPGTSDPLPFFITASGAQVTSSATMSGNNPTVTTGAGGITATGASGSGTVTVAQYGSNPGLTVLSGGTGSYFDVHLAPGYTLTSLAITFCSLNDATGISWLNGVFWSPVSPAAIAMGTGCLQFVATATSSPSLSQLTATPFGAVKPVAQPAATTAAVLPATGFAPDQVTMLPPQAVPYADLGDLWLEIPRLGVQMPIVGVPRTGGEWDVSWLGTSAGWLEGSAFPTWAGNSVLTGHIWNADNSAGPFRYLNTLWWGDQVIVHAFGQEYIYEVRSVRQVAPTNISAMMKHEELPWLTLVTCRGYDERTGEYRYRILVRAVLIEVK